MMRTPVRIGMLRRGLEGALVYTLVGLIGVGPAALAQAGPEGASVQRGNVEITQVNSTDWQIRASDGSIIHYDRFDIAGDQLVRFVQDNANSRVLNRVFSENPTQILGRLQANGHVYLVNPAGVIIGNGARIDANGFHAAAGRISNEDFLAGRERFTDLKGSVSNQGTISGPDVTLSDDGARVVALAGRQVTNGALGELLGRIYVDGEDGWIVLAAGTDVLITASGDSFAVQIEGALAAPGELQLANHGSLEAKRGRIGIAAGDTAGLALFHTQVSQPDGSVVANAISGRQIAVQGGDGAQVSVAGTLDAHNASGAGGTIDISGSNVSVANAELDVSGSTRGGSLSISARDGGLGSREHAEAQLSVAADVAIDASGATGAGGAISLSTEGGLDYRTTNTNLDGTVDGADTPGTLRVSASQLVVNGSAAAGQAAISSGVLAAQGSATQGAHLVLAGSDSLRVAAAADLSGAKQTLALLGAVDTSAAPVTAAKDLTIAGNDIAVGALTSQMGNVAIDSSDDVALSGRIVANEVSVDAGTGATNARIALQDGVAFDATRVALVQDGTIGASASGGEVAAGDLAAIAARASSGAGGLAYELRSRAGGVELASETGRELDLVARARTAVTLADADGKLEARSAQLSTDGAWRPGFEVDVQGLAALRSGLAGAGDLSLEKRISAGSIELAAGNGTTSTSDPDGAAVRIASNDLLADGLRGFRLEQDASIDQRTAVGGAKLDVGLADNASYALVSRRGSVAVEVGELEKVDGQSVVLEARKTVDLDFTGSADRQLGNASGQLHSLAIRSGDSHTVDYDVVTGGMDSSIELRAGVARDSGDDVSGDLTLSSGRKLVAEHIALGAGDGEPNFGSGASGRVVLPSDVQFRRADGSSVAPKSFSLEQDAGIGGPLGTRVTRAQLGDRSGLPGEGEDVIVLRSRQGSVTIDGDADESDAKDESLAGLLDQTRATLGARTPPPGSEDDSQQGVRLLADRLALKSLTVESDLIVDRSNDGGSDDLVSLESAGGIDLIGPTPDTPGSRGNLLVRSGAKLSVKAGGDLFAGRVEATPTPAARPVAIDAAPSEFDLQIAARGVDLSAIEASGSTDRHGADVHVDASGDVKIGSISADAGTALNVSDLDGGTVVVRGRSLEIGDVLARGGSTATTADGGKVLLDATAAGGKISLTGSRYETRASSSLGTGGSLTFDGRVELTAPAVGFITGDLTATGALSVGDSQRADPETSVVATASSGIDLAAGADAGAGSLSLTSAGDIALGGNVSAANLLELIVDSDGVGGGRFGGTGPIDLASQEIRISAGSTASGSDAELEAEDLQRFTLKGESGAGSPLRFQLAQDRKVDLEGADALLLADRFAGGKAGMEYAVSSRRAGVDLSNATVGDTHLSVSVAGTTGTAAPTAENGGITVAGGSLEVRSAELVADRDLRVGFAIDTTLGGDDSSITLVSGQAASGDLTLSSALRADRIALVAGNVGVTSGSSVAFEAGARLLRGGSGELAPRSLGIEQDDSITKGPDLAALMPSAGRDGMRLALISHLGDITLDDPARVAGTQLSLLGRNLEIDAPLALANLDALGTGSVTVDGAVTASGNQPASDGTWAASYIRLHAGAAGANRNLTVNSALAADEIALRTGTQVFDPEVRGASRVVLGTGARLGGLAGSKLARLTLEQDANLGDATSPIPLSAIAPADLPGLDLTLISNSGEVTVAGSTQAQLAQTSLALHGARGVTLEAAASGGLAFGSLVARVGTRAGSGGALPAIEIGDSLRTERGELNLLGNVLVAGAGDRSLVARAGSGVTDGIVRVDGTLARSDGPVDGAIGNVSLEADDEISVAQIDVSGTDARRNAGSVQVASGGLAEVGSVRAVGRRVGEQGGNGGNLEIDGAVVRVGAIDTGAERGNGGAVYLGTGPSGDRVAGTQRVELAGGISTLGQKPSENAVEQAGNLVIGAPLVLQTGGGTLDAGAIELGSGMRFAGNGGVTATGDEVLDANARGKLTASGDLVAREVELAGIGANGSVDLLGVGNILADRIALEAGAGGATLSIPPSIALRNLAGEDHSDAVRITQDAALEFGGTGNQLIRRENLVDPGGDLDGLELALESRQGQVRVADPADVAGTRLTLRGSGATAVQVDGDLEVEQLTLGSGNARVAGTLDVEQDLSAAGNLEVAGPRAQIGGRVELVADQDEQTLAVGSGGSGTLALGGDVLRQRSSGRGDLRIAAQTLELTGNGNQRIAAHGAVPSGSPAGTQPQGSLTLTASAPLRKAVGDLTLEADTGIDLSAIGGPGPAVETQAGNLTLRTRSGSTKLGGSLAAGGDLVADTNLDFSSATGETALRATGGVSALQGATVSGRDLSLESQSGVIHTGGRFAITGGDFRASSDLVVDADTRVESTHAQLRGATGSGDLSIAASQSIGLAGDVALAAGTSLELSAQQLQLSASAGKQSLEAGSISLARSGSGSGVLIGRDGDLALRASSGNLSTASGTQLVATGDLEATAAGAIQLGDSAAARQVTLRSGKLAVAGSVLANQIVSSAAPSGGTFATPSGNEVSSELTSSRAVRRALFADGRQLTEADLAGWMADGQIDPNVPQGPALGEVADDAAIWRTAPGAHIPLRVGRQAAAAISDRPLWVDEVVRFLRSDPGGSDRVASVSAGDRQAQPLHQRLLGDDARRASDLYWELFRPTYATDPEAAIARQAELQALFAAAADGSGDPRALMRRIASDPGHAEALAAARQAAALLERVRALGLVEADYAALRTQLVGSLAPEGIDPAQFAEALDEEF